MSDPITTTLNAVRNGRLDLPCETGWLTLLRHLGKTRADDEPLPVSVVLDSNGLDDALWVLDTLSEHRILQLWGCDCAERALPVFERKRPGDDRPCRVIETVRRFACGWATYVELNAARAAEAAWAAWDAVAVWTRRNAWDAARDAARAAARAAGDAWDDEREWQVERLRWYLEGEPAAATLARRAAIFAPRSRRRKQ